MEHHLKIHPEYFIEVLLGTKPFEIRKNDRDFKIGDTLHLLEYCPDKKEYTGDSCTRKISYILKGGSFGIKKDYVVMGLKNTPSLQLLQRDKLIEFAYDMNLQNLNPRYTENQAFKEGIVVGIAEMSEYLNTQ